MNNKKLIIVKISGASLKGEHDLFNIDFLNELARQVKELQKDFKVALVLGGGNIWRGNLASNFQMERYKADQIGMLATVMNSLALQSALKNINVKSNIFSTIEMDKIADSYIIRNIDESLNRSEIAILACGIGRPYFTTDTGIAVSAAELGASYILMGKNNVDGVYDSDPNTNENAKFFSHLTYSKAIHDELKVMDATAAAICKQTNIKTIVFKINEPNGILDALNLKTRFTLISEEEDDLKSLKFLEKEITESKITVDNKKDFTDEEVEKFLEEESPIFAQIADDDIEAIEKFLSQANELNNNENEEVYDVDEKDFASEFFNWNKEKSNEDHELNSLISDFKELNKKVEEIISEAKIKEKDIENNKEIKFNASEKIDFYLKEVKKISDNIREKNEKIIEIREAIEKNKL